jgi:hypothetical protein
MCFTLPKQQDNVVNPILTLYSQGRLEVAHPRSYFWKRKLDLGQGWIDRRLEKARLSMYV